MSKNRYKEQLAAINAEARQAILQVRAERQAAIDNASNCFAEDCRGFLAKTEKLKQQYKMTDDKQARQTLKQTIQESQANARAAISRAKAVEEERLIKAIQEERDAINRIREERIQKIEGSAVIIPPGALTTSAISQILPPINGAVPLLEGEANKPGNAFPLNEGIRVIEGKPHAAGEPEMPAKSADIEEKEYLPADKPERAQLDKLPELGGSGLEDIRQAMEEIIARAKHERQKRLDSGAVSGINGNALLPISHIPTHEPRGIELDDASNRKVSASDSRVSPFQELVEYIAMSLAESPDSVVVTGKIDEGNNIIVQLLVASDDKAHIIGKKRHVIQAIRTLIQAKAAKAGVRVFVKMF